MRRRIMLLVSGMTILVVLAFAIPLAVVIPSAVQRDAENTAKNHAAQVARFLADGMPTTAEIQSYLTGLPWGKQTTVTLPDCTTVGSSSPALPGPFGCDLNRDNGARRDPPPGGGADDVQVTSAPGGRVAFTSAPYGRNAPAQVEVFVSNADLQSGQTGWWALLSGGSVALLFVGIVAAEVLTRRIVRPLLRTAHTANQLTAGDLSARAPKTPVAEVAEVGSALNRLADRIEELLAEERETVADLSHRLRTPLTALRLDAEALRDPAESERVGAQVTALERTLTAVIRAARRPQREGLVPATDATAVVDERVGFWSALADDQDREREVSLPDHPVLVRASAEDLAAAVDALLENVIAHTPEGTPFSVRLTEENGGARLVVADAGPGLPDGAAVRGRSDRSSGLGLDIARRSAEASGGGMRIDRSETGGASICLDLGGP
jgi:signal transduction histidine kinase